jgi:hypothetical protein
LDIFSAIREDWLKKDPAYMRQGCAEYSGRGAPPFFYSGLF